MPNSSSTATTLTTALSPIEASNLLRSPDSPFLESGLKAEYFDGENFTQLKVTRIDATVDFNWGQGSPDAQIAPDTFSVRWTGQIQAAYSEAYTFYTTGDDGIRLWVNGQQVINGWRDQSATEYAGTVSLTAGQKYDIRLEYYENGGDAVSKLSWSSAHQTKQIIPQTYLSQPSAPIAVQVGNGNGLKAEYFDNADFTNAKLTRTDASVNFDWKQNAPDASMGVDTFSVRWTGQVLAQFNEIYTFNTTGDDGIRLWVNGQQIINGWRDQSATNYTGSIALQAGQKYDIKLEYYENGGDALAKLAWSSAQQGWQIIPQSQLFSPNPISNPNPIPNPNPISNPNPLQTGLFNYSEALQKSIYFYDAQRSGILPTNNRVEWRGNSGLTDGADVGKDLTGGFLDAGDKIKFSRTIAYTASTLAWGMLESPDAYSRSGQQGYLLENIKWATDYLLKAFTNDQAGQYEFYTQVGQMIDTPRGDHQNWVAAEVAAEVSDRPSYKINTQTPDSAIAGQTAAAFASASILFRQTDNVAYADLLLDKAKRMFDFGDRYRGMNAQVAANGSQDTSSPYTDWNYYDELVWGATWIHKAEIAKNGTYGNAFLARAEQLYTDGAGAMRNRVDVPYSWQSVDKGADVLLSGLSNNPTIYRTEIQNHLDYWTTGYNGRTIQKSPGGMGIQDPWGTLRYSTTQAFVALAYSDRVTNAEQKAKYQDFALKQVNYALGDNPTGRSYMIGFGPNPVQAVHHATANGPWAGWDQYNSNGRPRHVLYGALVGGPNSQDQYSDDMTNYQSTEVAIDYNAGLTGALARLYQIYGGNPLSNFPTPERRDDEYFVEASVKGSGSNFIEIDAAINNRSAWAARVTDKLSFRYYFTIEPNMNPNSLSVSVYNAQGQVRSSIKQAQGSLYYADIDFSGTKIFPGGTDRSTGVPNYRKQTTFRISGVNNWDSSNDWSYQGLSNGGLVKSVKIPVYDNGVKLFGNEPI